MAQDNSAEIISIDDSLLDDASVFDDEDIPDVLKEEVVEVEENGAHDQGKFDS